MSKAINPELLYKKLGKYLYNFRPDRQGVIWRSLVNLIRGLQGN